ncbi:MAG: hypothetical protein WBP45_06665 [Daejeonella sp.]
MKKSLIVILFAGSIFAANAQTSPSSDGKILSKHGFPIKPEAGDWGVTIDATPFLKYAGNFFSFRDGGDENQAPTYNNLNNLGSANNPVTVTGRYFLADNRSVAVDFTLGMNSTTSNEVNMVDPDQFNTTKISYQNIGIGAAYEFRKGIARIVGSYGPHISIASLSAPTTYDDMGVVVTQGGKVEFEDGENSDNNTTIKGGNQFVLGVGGFLGVEYYFAPKISLGGRFALDLNSTSTSKRVKEFSNGQDDSPVAEKGSAFSLGNKAASSISLNFYF